MTAAFLQSELASLIQDSKRRQTDVKTAAEKSLAELKAIQVTSETQLAGDLLRRPQFIDPFILACNSKYVKLAVTGAICLQRLVASRAISPSRLADVLDAFQEASQQGLDVQLKILQALPSLLQLYASELYGDALAKVLSLCAGLAGNKTGLVSSTAVATFQQLVTTLFDKQDQAVANDDDVGIEDADDAARIFEDMCMIIGGGQPRFLKSNGLTLPLTLEVIELSLSNPRITILDTPSCLSACEDFLIPGLNAILTKSTSFFAFGRCLRAIHLLVTRELGRLLGGLSESMTTVLAIMDRPSGPSWRRILCLEFMRNIVGDHQLFRTIYALFDGVRERRNVVSDLMSILVRIAAEDPALIGLGRQSTIPTNTETENANTGGGRVDVDAVGSVLQANSNVAGISSRWSMLNKSLLEQLDGSIVPDIPETYVYTLILGCIASLSDGLSKFVMPLSVPNRWVLEALDDAEIDGVPQRKNSQVRKAEKYHRLQNPLKREDLPSKDEIESCARLIEDCWPAVLATCSTFLNSALDSHFYHILVRTVQKLAQVSGVLELFTPRDALLTTLAKVSVPVNVSAVVTALHGNKLARNSRDEADIDTDAMSIRSAVSGTPRISVDVSRQPLNVRNLLCLRALLNLGIALGPTLSDTSWFIIIQALQQVDALMSVNPTTRAVASRASLQEGVDTDGQTNLGSEITAVSTASKRMIESTKTYSDEMLEVFIHSVFKVVDSLFPQSVDGEVKKSTADNRTSSVAFQKHKVNRSVSGQLATAAVLYVEAEFVLKTINDLARVNLYRFCSLNSQPCSWDIVASRLLLVVADTSITSQLRLQAAGILNSISFEAMKLLEKQDQDSEELSQLQSMCLNVLAKQLSLLYDKENIQMILVTDVDIHRRMLEALEGIVSLCGDSLTSGWKIVFEILQRTTRQTEADVSEIANKPYDPDRESVLERTISPAFRTVQLIVSDFLSTIDPLSFSILIQLLRSFGMQKNDLNVSLTTTVLFSNLSSLLLERIDVVDVQLPSKTPARQTKNEQAVINRNATDIPSLWFAIIHQLCLICADSRGDVRNSALRVLIRIFESSSTQLSVGTWNISFQEAMIPILEDYCGKGHEAAMWHVSYTQLLEGLVSLFVQNADTITTYASFPTTWLVLIHVLNSKLSEQTFAGHTIVFLSAVELLRALYTTETRGDKFVLPMLRCWSQNHPALIPVEDKSNQDALCAHAQLFSAIMETASSALKNLDVDGRSLSDVAMIANKQAALASVHPPYSSDVVRLSSEQVAVLSNLEVIKSMMSARRQDYATFLLDFISSILARNTAIDIEQNTTGKGSRTLKQPTLIALMSSSVDILRRLVQEEATDGDFLNSIPTRDATTILTNIATTKYSTLPSNSESPVWQNATDGIVELVEASQSHVQHMNPSQISALSEPIVHALRAITTAPALENKTPPIQPEIVIKDETFDIEHLVRLQRASTTLLQQTSFSHQSCKQYIMTLFSASLIAKPWFGDLPSDLLNKPLLGLNDTRRGSIRPPDFFPRTRIPYESLSALIGLIDRNNTNMDNLVIATAASPYVILRIAHSIKVFLADQQLRNLIPPPRPSVRELNFVLKKALELRVVDEAFSELMTAASRSSGAATDGKTHLRILYPLILRLAELWTRLPRLKVCAWQDDEDGLGIKGALDGWGAVLTEGWCVDTL